MLRLGFHPACLAQPACRLADLALRGVDDLFPGGQLRPKLRRRLVGDVQRLVDHGAGGRLHLGSLVLGEGAHRFHRSIALLAEHLIFHPRARKSASDGSSQGHRDCPSDERLVLDQSVEAMTHVTARPGSAPTRGSGAMADSAAGIADGIAGPSESGARRMRQFGGALADALDRFGDPLANPAGNVGNALAKAALARCVIAIWVLCFGHEPSALLPYAEAPGIDGSGKPIAPVAAGTSRSGSSQSRPSSRGLPEPAMSQASPTPVSRAASGLSRSDRPRLRLTSPPFSPTAFTS